MPSNYVWRESFLAETILAPIRGYPYNFLTFAISNNLWKKSLYFLGPVDKSPKTLPKSPKIYYN